MSVGDGEEVEEGEPGRVGMGMGEGERGEGRKSEREELGDRALLRGEIS